MTLTIRLLGGLTTTLNDQLQTGQLNRRAELLLGYLAAEPMPHSREQLVTLFYGDRPQRQALSNLRTLLARLRPIDDYLHVTRQTVQISADITTDLANFESAIDADDLTAAVDLYRGDLLADVPLGESRALEEWVAVRREQLRQTMIDALHRLAQRQLHQRNYQDGIQHAQRLITLDLFHETGRRLLMRLHAHAGQFNAALEQYADCVRVLRRELGIEPAYQTRRLHERLLAARERKPLQLTAHLPPLTGRLRESAEIQHALTQTRLLTLHGSGGIGKTRLARHIAELVWTDFLDGVTFVALQAATDLPIALRDALDLPATPQQTPQAQLIAALQSQERLLIFDNIEHLLPTATPFVHALLQAAPSIRIIVTSRERLNHSLEQLYPLQGLAAADAVALFMMTARRTRPTFDEVDTAQRICERVAGWPLAVELAASLAAEQGATAALAQIQMSYDVLQSAYFDTPDRHRTLRAVFEGSWARLTVVEQIILAKLAVFRGEFSAEKAAQIAAATSAALQSLAHKSLLQCENDRYDLHPVVREYALAKLDDPLTVQRRHATVFADWFAAQPLKSAEQIAAVARVERERPNLQAAWQYALAQREWLLIDQQLESWHLLFEVRSDFRVATAHFDAAALQVSADEEPLLFGRLRFQQGYFHERIGNLPEATAFLEESLHYLRLLDARRDMLPALAHLGVTAFSAGDARRAREFGLEAIALAREVGSARQLAHCLTQTGSADIALGLLESAEQHLLEAVELLKEGGDLHRLTVARGGLADLYREQDRLDESAVIYRTNITTCEQLGDGMGEAISRLNLAKIEMARGAYESAEAMLTQVLQRNAAQRQLPWIEARASTVLGELYLAQSQPTQATSCFERVLELSILHNDEAGQARAYLGLGQAALQSGEKAIPHLQKAHALALAGGRLPLAEKCAALLAQLS